MPVQLVESDTSELAVAAIAGLERHLHRLQGDARLALRAVLCFHGNPGLEDTENPGRTAATERSLSTRKRKQCGRIQAGPHNAGSALR